MSTIARIYLWWVLRMMGLGCLVLACFYSALTLQMEADYTPMAERLQVMITSLTLFCGTLVFLPTTTPIWVRQIEGTVSGTATIATLLALSAVIMNGGQFIIPVFFAPLETILSFVFGPVLVVATILALFATTYLAAAAPKDQRRVPLMTQRKRRTSAPNVRMLRKARS